jgi:hypothetical protein
MVELALASWPVAPGKGLRMPLAIRRWPSGCAQWPPAHGATGRCAQARLLGTARWTPRHHALVCRQLAAANKSVEPEALYEHDGRVWTSGGVTAGIDMCLAMVEEDVGRELATRVARQLVLSTRGLGNQSQYSQVLELQSGRCAKLIDWVRAHLNERPGRGPSCRFRGGVRPPLPSPLRHDPASVPGRSRRRPPPQARPGKINPVKSTIWWLLCSSGSEH